MVEQDNITKSKAIHRRTGRTFYYATRLLPDRVRNATYVLYAFFRVADEVVDDADGVSSEQQRRRLEELRAEALGEVEPESPVLAAFQEVRAENGIDDATVEEFIDAMATDIGKRRYRNYEELEAYMGGSAVAVASMMTAVMDPDDPETARSHAKALGEAFQLTNFLRDVREDVIERDRIYLPETTLAEHGVTAEQIERFEMDENFAAVMQAELARTERLYREGVAGIKYLPEDCQLPVLLAAVLYAEHHRLIRNCGYDVLNQEPELGTLRKLSLVVRTRWRWQWSNDPEEVFRRVSAVGGARSPSRAPHHESLPAR
ncbi:phytoene/squalene synthase family protein [Halalkalicoccus ordinarius]|uniref:phytoene/squalene synthase family protein n=1 Tax=Halalkalicoccus ordinarius TaxID=3116651 RepID=UPI00300E86A7